MNGKLMKRCIISILSLCCVLLQAGETVVSRVVGGQNEPVGNWSSGAKIKVQGQPYGTGVLISKRVVLTAGHILHSQQGGRVAAGSYEIELGNERFTVIQTDPHPSYSMNSQPGTEGVYDLGVLILNRDATNITPETPARTPITVNSAITIVGFGYQGGGQNTPIYPPEGQVGVGNTTLDNVTQTFISWTYVAGKCSGAPGDSGGPAFFTNGGNRTVVGITSFGDSQTPTIGTRSFYTRVDTAIGWIDQKVNENGGGGGGGGGDAANVGSVQISPLQATVTVAGQHQFSAVVRDLEGNIIDAPLTWSVPSHAGTISSTGLFTAGTKSGGPFSVIAKAGDKTATATVTINAADLVKTSISPAYAEIPKGGSSQFSLSGSDAYGNTVNAASAMWRVSGGGTVQNGKLIANNQKSGPHTITGVVKGLEATATFIVINQAPKFISFPRATPTVAVAPATILFSAFGIDPDGDPITYAWSFDDGTTQNGTEVSHSYTVPGIFSILCTMTDGDGAVVAQRLGVRIEGPLWDEQDGDGDGFTNGSEVSSGTNFNDPASFPSSNADRDGDGVPDGQDLDDDNDGVRDSIELSQGTDPWDAASVLKLSFVAKKLRAKWSQKGSQLALDGLLTPAPTVSSSTPQDVKILIDGHTIFERDLDEKRAFSDRMESVKLSQNVIWKNNSSYVTCGIKLKNEKFGAALKAILAAQGENLDRIEVSVLVNGVLYAGAVDLEVKNSKRSTNIGLKKN